MSHCPVCSAPPLWLSSYNRSRPLDDSIAASMNTGLFSSFDWLFALTVIFSRFIRVAACDRIALFKAEQCSNARVYPILSSRVVCVLVFVGAHVGVDVRACVCGGRRSSVAISLQVLPSLLFETVSPSHWSGT